MKKFLVTGGIGLIVLVLIAVLMFIIYGIITKVKPKPSPEKPVIDYTRIVSTPVFNAFVELTNKNHIALGDTNLTPNEKIQTNIAMGIAKHITTMHATDIKKAQTANSLDALVALVRKMSGEFTDTAIGMKIQASVFANVNNNYLAELSKPGMTQTLLIKRWEATN